MGVGSHPWPGAQGSTLYSHQDSSLTRCSVFNTLYKHQDSSLTRTRCSVFNTLYRHQDSSLTRCLGFNTLNRVSIRKTFAQFLRNETQNFSFFAHQFYAKKQQFAQSFAKVISRKIALFRFCETQVLLNSAISYQNPKQIVQ